jgi:hypothetical protein
MLLLHAAAAAAAGSTLLVSLPLGSAAAAAAADAAAVVAVVVAAVVVVLVVAGLTSSSRMSSLRVARSVGLMSLVKAAREMAPCVVQSYSAIMLRSSTARMLIAATANKHLQRYLMQAVLITGPTRRQHLALQYFHRMIKESCSSRKYTVCCARCTILTYNDSCNQRHLQQLHNAIDCKEHSCSTC